MKWLVLACLACGPAVRAQPAPPPPSPPKPPVPSGPVKAFEGPEGELVVMVEANDGAQMLVHFRRIDRRIDGTTVNYLHEDQGRGDKVVFVNYKRGSKWYRSVLLSAERGRWHFRHPHRPEVHFWLRYSRAESARISVEDVLRGYQP